MDLGTVIFLGLLFLLGIVSFFRQKKFEKIIQNLMDSAVQYEVDIAKYKKSIIELQIEKDALIAKYSLIIDIEKEAENIRQDAQRIHAKADKKLTRINEQVITMGNEAKSQAANIVSFAEQQAKDLIGETNQKLKASRKKADLIKTEARQEAENIISFAEFRAKEIAGDAYEAKAKADSYETAIRAMKNTIDGYKDDYIVPNHSVLDDLADEFSHKEAGERLKAVRKRMREMVKNGYAGKCDYVEAHRKTYAIHFAVDAFNGKVDSALAKVKHDNFGKIKQEIIDAFALVNHNGAPFRNARIEQEYLDLRLEELKWAVATFELRKAEREEQAAIKAQIREEEKAAREMEKAIKVAEKEERLIQAALKKAKDEMLAANDEQKAEYEAQLAELEAKLKDAEDRGQRALSMAQQTRRGHVYVISNIGSFGEKVFKIGMTRRLEPMDRVKELGDASVPFSFDVHAMIYSEDAPALEKDLHRRFNAQSVNKVNPRKEFFNTTIAEVKQAVEQHGITDIHWTLKAEAAEYRESLAIEKEICSETVA